MGKPEKARESKPRTPKEMPTSREGLIEVKGGKVWYKIVGTESKGTPLLTLHGGPGGSSGTLVALEALSDDRPIIFYDQLGAGNSDRPEDDSLWTLNRYIDEVEAVRAALNIENFHLFGHSWGGLLAAEYSFREPHRVQSLFLSSPLLSVQRWLTDTNELKQLLPESVREAIERNERVGTTNSEEYKEASEGFDRKHYCLVHPYPEVVLNAKKVANNKIYEIMWGPSEFSCTGNLAGYDITGKLGDVGIPVFLSCGRHDEVLVRTLEYYRNLFKNAKMHVFEESAHIPYVEEPDLYVEVVRNFLNEAENHSGHD